ncbi:MAG: metal-dependent hydrolase [Pseudomonadota bacterium]
MNANPMNHITVRKLRFAFDETQTRQPIWSKSSPEFAMFINALGVDVPHFERFLVQVMRTFRNEIQDQGLLKDVQAIIGQESHHAFNFTKWNAELAKRYSKLTEIDGNTKQHFEHVLESKSKKYQIGFTAGYETFTFLGGLIILDRYQELMGDADPVIRAMWVWHQVEEVEHGAVAHDFYQLFYSECEWYRKAMVCRAFFHILSETFKSYRHMVQVEHYYESPGRALKAWGFFVSFGWDLAYSALPVLLKNYHPKNHPICNNKQNKIAVAWRKHFESGNDILSLSDELMAGMQVSE